MLRQGTTTITFTAQVQLEDRGDHWAAYIVPPGTTVYGATHDAVKARVDEAMSFFADSLVGAVGVERFQRYLDAHGVQNSVVVTDDYPVQATRPAPFTVADNYPIRVSSTVPGNSLMEVAASV